MDDIIARIKHKLAYLQEHNDSGNLIEDLGGKSLHSYYAVYGVHTEEDIAAFETKHHIRLPDDYRRFIHEIGSEGFNPGRIMYSPLARMLTNDEASDFYRRMEEEFEDDEIGMTVDEDELWKEMAPILGKLDDSFPFHEITTPDVVDRFNEIFTGSTFWHGNGYLPIIEREQQGSSYILIVTGKAHGQIWYQEGMRYFTPVFLIDGQSHRPLYGQEHKVPPDAQRLTFTQWYEIWLDQQIPIKQEQWRKEGRNIPPLTLE